MPRGEIMALMKTLKFVGIPKAYDEVLAAGCKRRQSVEIIIEELLQIEVGERSARSIRYRMTQARFPVPKGLDSFEFDKLPVDESQIRTLYGCDFIEQQRNVVFVLFWGGPVFGACLQLLTETDDDTNRVFEELQLQGGGHTWEPLLRSLVRMRMPEHCQTIETGAEADNMYVYCRDHSVLEEIAELVRSATKDHALLRAAVSSADPDLE